MRSSQGNQGGVLEAVVRVGLTLVVLAVATAVLGAFRGDRFSRWPLLLELVGASTLLVGVIGLLRRVCIRPHATVSAVAGDIAVVLAGAILVGGGWGAALGLGVIAAAGLLAERCKADESDHSA